MCSLILFRVSFSWFCVCFNVLSQVDGILVSVMCEVCLCYQGQLASCVCAFSFLLIVYPQQSIEIRHRFLSVSFIMLCFEMEVRLSMNNSLVIFQFLIHYSDNTP